MQGLNLIKLAADLTAGNITASAIEELYGDNILSVVLQLSGAGVAGVVTNSILDKIEEETGIVSDVGGLIDDVFSIF